MYLIFKWKKKKGFAWSGKKTKLILSTDCTKYCVRQGFAPATGHILVPSEFLIIYFVCDDFQPSNPGGYGLLYIGKY